LAIRLRRSLEQSRRFAARRRIGSHHAARQTLKRAVFSVPLCLCGNLLDPIAA